MPKAFAIVKETARRFATCNTITVTAQDYDKKMVTHADHVTIEGNKATWSNTWDVMGNSVTWNMVHYDVQLMGGITLHQGKIAEMATGEGKTLVSTLAAFLNALGGNSVHIITVNDYLAKRDAAWMAPIFEFHGLTVACIDKTLPYSLERKEAYHADIIYGTNNEFGFDYLRDNMVIHADELVQKNHYFAIVDEVDSVLIDDARTPLIISGPVSESDEHVYKELAPRIKQLYQLQRELATSFLQEAKQKITAGAIEEGGLALFRAHRALPRYKALIKYLSQQGIRKILDKIEGYYLQENSRMMPEADEPLYFTIDERNNSVEITDKGIQHLTQQEKDASFFILPDISMAIFAIENNNTLTQDEKLQKKGEIQASYKTKSHRIHAMQQLLKGYTLFEKDIAYIVTHGKVKIVDEQTGRVLDGRRYSDGLHQALEAKEGVKIERPSQTYASITLQSYFHMYFKLAGMTGTAETDAEEFWDIYGLSVVKTPTHRPVMRDDKEDQVYKTVREKFQAIIEEIIALSQKNRPVLVGTTSVEVSELVSKMLSLRKVKHQILNAKHHQKEAQIVAAAGEAGTVTIATNMAGRGTDIKLSALAKEAGGLAIIGTERHESRRVDRQLRGRAGRQGDTGSSQFFLSLEDSLMRLFGSDRIISIMDKIGLEEGEVIQHSMVTRSIEKAQKKIEQNNFAMRKRLLEYDREMGTHRQAVYHRRNNALMGKGMDLDVMNLIYDTTACYVEAQKIYAYTTFKQDMLVNLGIHEPVDETILRNQKESDQVTTMYQHLIHTYIARRATLKAKLCERFTAIFSQNKAPLEQSGHVMIPIFDGTTSVRVATSYQEFIASKGESLLKNMEQVVILTFIDKRWKEHLRAMDDLKEAVQNAVYERKDPIITYKFEAYNLFKSFIHDVSKETTSYLFKALNYIQELESIEETGGGNLTIAMELQESRHELHTNNTTEGSNEVPTAQPIKSQKVAKRNERVTVRYQDGTVRADVKFKSVEEAINENKCVIVEKIK